MPGLSGVPPLCDGQDAGRSREGDLEKEVKMRSFIAATGWLGLCTPLAALAASRPEAEESWIVVALVNWAPMLILVGVWFFFFMRRWQTGHVSRQREHMERVETQLERIATALERKQGPGR